MAKEGQSGLEAITGALQRAGKGPPPVELWNPPFCGDLDMRIAADGTWFYLKTPIGRPALVKLFASVLKREGEKYFLVTPVEKCGIRVDDAPFLAVELNVEAGVAGRVLNFRTNVDDWVACGPRHGLRFEPEAGNRRPKTLSSRPPRFVGKGNARAVLRSRRAWRRARDRRHGDVRRVVHGRVLSDGAGGAIEGIRVNDRTRCIARSGDGELLRPRACAAHARRAGGADRSGGARRPRRSRPQSGACGARPA